MAIVVCGAGVGLDDVVVGLAEGEPVGVAEQLVAPTANAATSTTVADFQCSIRPRHFLDVSGRDASLTEIVAPIHGTAGVTHEQRFRVAIVDGAPRPRRVFMRRIGDDPDQMRAGACPVRQQTASRCLEACDSCSTEAGQGRPKSARRESLDGPGKLRWDNGWASVIHSRPASPFGPNGRRCTIVARTSFSSPS